MKQTINDALSKNPFDKLPITWASLLLNFVKNKEVNRKI